MLQGLRRFFGLDQSLNRDPADEFWYGPIGLGNAADYPVTSATALQHPAVLASLQMLAEDVAKLPVVVFRRKTDGSKEVLRDHPAAIVLRNPNLDDTGAEFRQQMMWDLAWHRNAYAEIVPGRRGATDQLIPLPAGDVTVSRNGGRGSVSYSYPDPTKPGSTRVLRRDQVWHLKTMPLRSDRLTGAPVWETNHEPIAAALAAQDYAARFFANDAKSGGVIETPPGFKFKSDEDRRKWMAAWQAGATKGNRHKDRFLEYGFKYERQGATPDESQFVQTKLAHDVAIARIWRIPPHKLGILDRATFSNIEQQAIEYVTDCLVWWLVLWEQSISKWLIIEDDVFAEFNVAGLLRGDTLARYQAYGIARNWGWLSVNDIRRLENLDPIGEDGDEYLRPANTLPLGEEVQPKPEPQTMREPEPAPRPPEDDAAWVAGKDFAQFRDRVNGHKEPKQ